MVARYCGFRVLVSLLHRRRSMEVNQTLHDVWPSPGLVHYVYTFWGLLPPNRILPGAKFALLPSLAFSYLDTGSVTVWQSSSGRQQTFAARYLYATVQLSRSTLGGRTVQLFPTFYVTKIITTRMWAAAQRHGRPAEYTWRPVLTAKITKPTRETR